MVSPEDFLVLKFILSEPNLASARKRNTEGLCCHPDCDNKLSTPPDTAYYGLNVCKRCRAKLDRILEAENRRALRILDEEFISQVRSQIPE